MLENRSVQSPIQDDMDVDRNLEVSEFYRGSTILITGATGFAGQVLLEKILRQLNPRKLYVLVRRKRGENARQRIKQLFNNVVSKSEVRSSTLYNMSISCSFLTRFAKMICQSA